MMKRGEKCKHVHCIQQSDDKIGKLECNEVSGSIKAGIFFTGLIMVCHVDI
jgi:hypothetical protein